MSDNKAKREELEKIYGSGSMFQKSKAEEYVASLPKIKGFKKNINFLYTGCTRAKDELTIILSAPKGESIYMDILRETIRKDN